MQPPDERSEAGAKPWVAANRRGKSLKGRDKLCNSGHFEVGAGKGLSHPFSVAKGSKGRRVEKSKSLKSSEETFFATIMTLLGFSLLFDSSTPFATASRGMV